MTLEQKVKELLSRLKEQAQHSFKSLSQDKPKLEIIMLFLAILHLIRERIASADQQDQFSDITVSAINDEPGIANQES